VQAAAAAAVAAESASEADAEVVERPVRPHDIVMVENERLECVSDDESWADVPPPSDTEQGTMRLDDFVDQVLLVFSAFLLL
jgi:hypothetical protein